MAARRQAASNRKGRPLESRESIGKPKTTKAKSATAKRKTSQKRLQAAKEPSPRFSSSELPPRVVIVSSDADDQFALLDSVLDQSRFWQHLESSRKRRKVAPAVFQVLIKPDTTLFEVGASTGTDPQLVEHLILRLHDRGYTRVAVVATSDSFDLWLQNRDVLTLAEIAGYRFQTDEGRDYEILDLGEDVVDVPFPEGSVLYGSGLSRVWVDADYRICFAKNRTDERHAYALCLENLLGVLPLRDKLYHYHHRLESSDACLALLQTIPVDFNLIDAFVSNHGEAGARVSRPLATRTLIAGENAILVDWVGAMKMGTDPFASPINAAALHKFGLPAPHTIEGDANPYAGWVNVPSLLLNSVRQRNEWSEADRLVTPLLQMVNRDLFPFKDLITDRMNSFVTRHLSDLENSPLALWALVGLNYSLSFLQKCIHARRVMFHKDNLHYCNPAVNIDASVLQPSDYERVVDYLEPLADLIQRTRADENGLRWRYLDDSVLFEFSREIPIGYEEFIERVDITGAIRFMNDYMGGTSLAAGRDGSGRTTHQIERNIYLPQPNYLVLYQGTMIDVTKLDYIRYRESAQQIFWKTVKSENDSAKHDDGIITFEKTERGYVRVSMMGRQEFKLPLFWQAVNLDLNPPVKNFLVRHAYTTFFTRTIANFEARYEGREIRVGRPWDDRRGEAGDDEQPTERLMELLGQVAKVIQPVLHSLQFGNAVTTAAPHAVDEDGFVHFRPADQRSAKGAEAPTRSEMGTSRPLVQVAVEILAFWNDLTDAFGRDLATNQQRIWDSGAGGISR